MLIHRFMVMCDYYANFYHPDCIGRTVAECEELNTLKCPTVKVMELMTQYTLKVKYNPQTSLK